MARLRAKALAGARVLTLLTTVLAVVACALVVRARAQLRETLFGVGEEMMRYADADRHSQVREMQINGQTLYLMSGSAERTVREVLDAYTSRCERNGNSEATLREETEERGFVACLDGTSLAPETLAEQWARFQQTHDLAAFGALRYTFVVHGANKTVFLNIWSAGSLRLDEAFPERGDARGVDPEVVPRPPSSRRILSASEVDAPYSLTMYAESDQSADALQAHYRRVMPSRGFTLLELDDASLVRAAQAFELSDAAVASLSRRARHHLVFENEDQLVSVHVSDHPRAGGTTTILISRGDGDVGRERAR